MNVLNDRVLLLSFSRAQMRSCFLDWNHCSSHFFGATMSLTDTRIKTAKPAEKIYKIYDTDGFHRPYIHKKEK